MQRRFHNTIMYPYKVPQLEGLLRMFCQNFGKLLGVEVFKALSDLGCDSSLGLCLQQGARCNRTSPWVACTYIVLFDIA